MTKLIAALIIVVVLYGGWQLFFYWERVKNEEETEKKKVVAEAVMGDQLPGMPYQLDASLRTALNLAATAVWRVSEEPLEPLGNEPLPTHG